MRTTLRPAYKVFGVAVSAQNLGPGVSALARNMGECSLDIDGLGFYGFLDKSEDD